MENDEGNSFKLKNEVNNDFDNRVNSVFSSLGSMESSYKENAKLFDDVTEPKNPKGEKLPPPSRPKFNQNKKFMKRRHWRPDYLVNPEKYTKYSLHYDGTSKIAAAKGMNADQLNKKIAMDFLDTLQKQRKKENDVVEGTSSFDDGYDSDKKHVYKYKPLARSSSSTESSSTSHFQSSHGAKAVVMDTFEFGSKKTSKKDIKENSKSETRDFAESKHNLSLDWNFNDNEDKDNDDITSVKQPDEKQQQSVFKLRKKNKGSYRKKIDNFLPETIQEQEEEN